MWVKNRPKKFEFPKLSPICPIIGREGVFNDIYVTTVLFFPWRSSFFGVLGLFVEKKDILPNFSFLDGESGTTDFDEIFMGKNILVLF